MRIRGISHVYKNKTMRLLFTIVILSFFSVVSRAQSDSLAPYKRPKFSNRCGSIDSTIHYYSYNDSSKTHDYSHNWDFDGDGATDSLTFIGTGGAHLYYFLRIVLSSDKKTRDFPFLEIDFPCLCNISRLKESNFYPPPHYPQIVVHDFDSDFTYEIYLHLDISTFSILSKKWKKRGLTSRYILLDYKNGKITITNFMDWLADRGTDNHW
jgi:hypothetical protein